MSLGHTKLHSAGGPSLARQQAHTSSSYSIQSHQSSRLSDATTLTQQTSASTLFPPPSAQTPDPNHVRPQQNVMNQVGEKEQSLFQICLILRQRLSGVPGFDGILEEEEQSADEDTDPVTLLWRTFRRGYPLMAIYNVLRPDKPLEVNVANMTDIKKAKQMTFKFINACLNELGFKVEDCFIILDLFGDDTTGFVRVTRMVTRLLDMGVERNVIEDTRRDSAEPFEGSTAGKRSQRQHIVDELVNTERTYVQHLEMLQDFQVQCQKTGVIPGDVIHQIFLNLNALLDFQRRFLIRVEQINAQPESEQNWGKLFVLYNDAFTIYEPYITNQKQCEATVMREFDKLKLAGGSPTLQGIVANSSTLYSFLMKPFQRLTKYPLLLNELYKKGDLDDERKADLLIGKDCATAVLSRTNAAIEREDRFAAVDELTGRVEDWKGHKVEQFGELLLYGTFTVLKSDSGTSKDSEREYHVYFFESILLCCKDIDPNKAKNKMKGKPLVDKKGKPKLQLKGRIFMQNVTDVVSTAKQGSYSCQIFWKGDPGIENFTIRFLTEDLMQKWYQKLVEQKKLWQEIASNSGNNRYTTTSQTEFISMQGQGQIENPYKNDEEDDDVDINAMLSNESYNSSHPTLAEFTSGWNQSQTSIRSRSATGESNAGAPGRMAPPRLPPGSLANPALSLRTQQLQSAAMSPSERFNDSYFSPVEESPMSSRTSTSSNMYFPRQGHASEGGYQHHVPYRSGSREGMNQQGYPASARQRPHYTSGPAPSMPGGFAPTGRNRSISSPSINEAQRRAMENNRPPMPDGMPSHIQQYPPAIHRSQSNSPHMASGLDERMGAPSPQARNFANSPSMGGYPLTSRNPTPTQNGQGTPHMGGASTPTIPQDSTPPSQLKVKVHATAAGQVLTLVVPSNITYQSLKDRIDAKLQRSTNISLTDRGAGNQVKLKYLDEDDYVNIASDEDVQTAFETWREQRGEGAIGLGEIELFCQ
ncbi:Rho guanine nucleotide exchange factor scd1 [Elsinoe australis]|uniref:Rho guanine nucleotide exchange factor scd1 n=1 Tax=Elsinoe australis TaxID=40998 RepID=A0A4U7AXK1_9PEZI|nr:Rho guanine nucleotide exchange factor scd1 [Elsinoe australis]